MWRTEDVDLIGRPYNSSDLFPFLKLAFAIHDDNGGLAAEELLLDELDSLLPERFAVSEYFETRRR